MKGNLPSPTLAFTCSAGRSLRSPAVFSFSVLGRVDYLWAQEW